MDARSLSDKTILEAMRRGGGVATIEHPDYGQFSLARTQGERPMQFLERFRGGYSAWYAEQEYQASGKARAAKASLREATSESVRTTDALQPAIQTSQESLDSIIRSKVDALTAELALAHSAVSTYADLAYLATHTAETLQRELALAKRFLKELEEGGHTPQTPQKVGGDIHSQVGQREPGGRSGVGETSSPEVREQGSEGTDAGDPGFSGDYEDPSIFP